jgi:hypothetical protein
MVGKKYWYVCITLRTSTSLCTNTYVPYIFFSKCPPNFNRPHFHLVMEKAQVYIKWICMWVNTRPSLIECGHSTIEPWNLYIIWVTRACIHGYLSYTQQHETTLHNSTWVHKTTNVPVVFMARYVMILRGATSLRGALEGVGPENLDFFGPKWHERRAQMARAQGPKKSRFSGPTSSNAPRNDVAPLKIITYRAIKTTGTLIVNTESICRSCALCIWPESELQNCFTTQNKMLGGEGASDR